jgi:hypothetical protein
MPFQAVERQVDGAQGGGAAGRNFQLARNRDAVPVIAQTENGEHDHQFVVSEEAWHFYIMYE